MAEASKHLALDEKTWFRYAPVSPKAKAMGSYVLNAGFTVVPPHSPYPPYQHPPDHQSVSQGRSLPAFIFVYITRGAGVLDSKVRRHQPVHAGDMIVLFPHVWHRYHPLAGKGWDEYWLEFDGDYVRRLMACEEFSAEELVYHIDVRDDVLDLFLKAIELLKNEPPGYQLLLGTLVAQTIAQVLSALKQQSPGDRSVAAIIREAKGWLVSDPAKAQNLNHLAARLNMSYSSFRRLFKAETGFSPRQFALEARLQKASELLARTDAAAGRIAEQCGMQSHYFSRLFKKKTGLAPTKFRRLHQTH